MLGGKGAKAPAAAAAAPKAGGAAVRAIAKPGAAAVAAPAAAAADAAASSAAPGSDAVAAGKKRGREEAASANAAAAAAAADPNAPRNVLIRAMEARADGATQRQLETALRLAGHPSTVDFLMGHIQALLRAKRVDMIELRSPGSSTGVASVFKIVSEDRAVKLQSLSADDQAVLALIEKSGTSGLWVRNMKLATKLQLQVCVNA